MPLSVPVCVCVFDCRFCLAMQKLQIKKYMKI